MRVGLQRLGERLDRLAGALLPVAGGVCGLGSFLIFGAKHEARAPGSLSHLLCPHPDGVQVGGVGPAEDSSVTQLTRKTVQAAGQGFRDQASVSKGNLNGQK